MGSPARRGPVDTLLQVRTEEPVSPRRLVPSVPRALDAVCRKCLHKEPRRRYLSAIALAEDLARFLAGRPVQARPVGAWERVLRWARRRKAVAALMAVIGLALVSLLTLGIWHYAQLKGYNAELRRERHTADTLRQVAEAKEAEASRQKEEAEKQWRRAEANFQSALAAVDQMLTRTSEDDQFLVHEPRMELLRQKLLEDALRFYEGFLRERADDPVVRWETASSYLRVGDIRKRLGRQATAEEAYGAAIPLLEALAAEFPGRPEYRYKLAGCYINLGGSLLLNTARLEEAERAFRRALDIQQPLTDEFPDNVEYRSTLSGIQINLGTVMIHTGRLGEAETILRQALDQRRRLADEHPENPRFRRDLARVHNNLGIVLGGTGRGREAGEAYRQALELQRALVEQFPRVAVYRQELAASHNTLAGVLGRMGREAEAETEYVQPLALQQRLVEEFPPVPAYRQEFAGSRYNLARSLDRRKRSTEAEEAYRQALELYERLVEEFPEVPTYQSPMGNNLTHLARLLGQQGRLTESCEKAERGRRCQLAALKLLPKDTRVQKAVAESCAVLAETRVRLKDHRGAAEVAAEVPRYSAREGSAYRYAAGFLARCAGIAEEDQTLPSARRQDLAKSYRDQALALLRQGAGFPNFGADSLTTDPHFASLRSRADFQEVLGAARR